MQKLTYSDLNFVLGRCPRDIVALLRKNAGFLFLAGGFIRSTISGEKVSDIDLFGVELGTRNAIEGIAKDLALERKGRIYTTKNAITVLASPRHPVQFITRWWYKRPEDLIASFDFTVCQAVIWASRLPDTLDENGKKKQNYYFHSMCSDAFYPDLAAKRLVYTHPVRAEEAGGSLMRAFKFVKKGYSIQAQSIAGVVARLVWGAYDNPEKKPRNELWMAAVITGLLHEVDPLFIIDGVDLVDEHEITQPQEATVNEE